MARRDFTVRDLVEIYLHWQSGQGIRKIASSLGVDRNTVRKYIRAAEEAGLCPPQQRSASEWAEFIRMTFPETVDRRAFIPHLLPDQFGTFVSGNFRTV